MPSSDSKRRTVKVKARQLEDVDVQFLSLVERGANRIPFRILKSEESKMINLGNLFLRKKDDVPTIVGVVVNKSADADGYARALAEAGYKFPVTEDTDSVSVRKAEGVEMEDVSVIKVSDELAVMVAHIEKGLSTYPDTESFLTNVTKAGFFPGFQTATGIMVETMYNISYAEGDQDATMGSIEKCLDQYKTYVMKLAQSVPADVFKMDSIKPLPAPETEKPAEVKKEDEPTEPEGNAAEEPTGEAAVKKTEDDGATKDTGGGDGGSAKATGETPIEGLDDEGTPVQKSETPESEEDPIAAQFAALASQLTQMGDKLSSLETITAAVGELKKSVTDTNAKLETVEALAKSADEAVRGTVLSGQTGGDPAPTEGAQAVKKKDAEDDTGMFDSVLKFPGFESV